MTSGKPSGVQSCWLGRYGAIRRLLLSEHYQRGADVPIFALAAQLDSQGQVHA